MKRLSHLDHNFLLTRNVSPEVVSSLRYKMTQTSDETDEDVIPLDGSTSRRIRRMESLLYIMAFLVVALLFDKVSSSKRNNTTTPSTMPDLSDIKMALTSIYDKLDVEVEQNRREIFKYASAVSELTDKINRIELDVTESLKKRVQNLKTELLSSIVDATSQSKNEQSTSEIEELQQETLSQVSYILDSDDTSLTASTKLEERQLSSVFQPNVPTCGDLPILSSINHKNNQVDHRLDTIMSVLRTVSSTKSLSHYNTPQYKAACWIMYDDDFQIAPTDRRFLERYVCVVFLYAAGYTDLQLFSKDACDYEEVSCNSQGHISVLNATNLSIIRAMENKVFPTELTNLRALQILDVSNNRMIGTIPTELGRLKVLEELYLHGNLFSGTLPTDIGRVKSLKIINLWGSSFEGSIPSEIGQCKDLEQLNITDNLLTGTIPTELFNCTNLKVLDLEKNSLGGTIPTHIQQLQNLEYMRIDFNDFSGQIPTEIGTFPSLRQLWIGYNFFTGPFPSEIGNLNSLEVLVMDDNALTGTLPNIFDKMSNLTVLQVASNDFTGEIPSSVWDHPGFFALILKSNNLFGTVPDDYCSKINHFKADYTSWFRDDPKVVCRCCKIDECHVWDIFEDLGDFMTLPPCPDHNIVRLEFYEQFWVNESAANISFHDFHGQSNFFQTDVCLSPTGCYGMEDVGKISLSKQLTFSQDTKNLTEEGDCEAVNICGKSIHVGHPRRKGLNHLTQVGLSTLAKLQDPTSAQNAILCWLLTQDIMYDEFHICDGTLLQRYVLALFYYTQPNAFDFDSFKAKHTCFWPGVICEKGNRFVEKIDLPQYNLTGTLMTEIQQLSRLQTLKLNGNHLTGAIDPVIFAQMPQLEIVDMGNNEFGGNLPTTLLVLPSLKELNMSMNKFIGTLPDDIEYPKSLASIDLRHNLLQGSIPTSLTQCGNLTQLVLSQNGFDGAIPSEVGRLEQLKVFKMNENFLSGSLPLELFNASKIEIFMVQGNSLTGIIPTEIGNFQELRRISMAHNNFKGRIPKELEKIPTMDLVHLHDNRLDGTTPNLNVLEHYITDCGDPFYLLQSPLVCPSCTICCNSDQRCQTNLNFAMKVPSLGFLLALIVPVIVTLVTAIACGGNNCHRSHLMAKFSDDGHYSCLFTTDSVYPLIFTDSILGWLIYASTAIVQSLLFYVFLSSSDFQSDDTDWLFTKICHENTLDCQDTSSVTPFGWIMLAIVTLTFLAGDLVKSLLQIRVAVESFDLRFAISGFVLCFLTTLALFTSIIYNRALAQSDTDLLTNAVILLFINDLDEALLIVVKSIKPYWGVARLGEIKARMVNLNRRASAMNRFNDDNDSSSLNEYPSPDQHYNLKIKRSLDTTTKEEDDANSNDNSLEDRHQKALQMLGMMIH